MQLKTNIDNDSITSPVWKYKNILSIFKKCIINFLRNIAQSPKYTQFFFCLFVFVFYSVCFLFFSLIFISWRLITSQYYSGFWQILTWISHGFTCVPHPEHPSHLPPHLILLGHPSAPALSTCLMHPTWTGDLFHPR